MLKRKLSYLKSVTERYFRESFIKIGGNSRFFSLIFYFFNRKFIGENEAVLSGIRKNISLTSNLGNFRRNIHRIEKGLITTPAKSYFANDYIIDTLNDYKFLYDSLDESTSKWSFGVLNQFFKTVEKTRNISNAEDIFKSIKIKSSEDKKITYNSKDRFKNMVTYDDYLHLNLRRRSIRYYEDIAVPRELIEKAIKAAVLAPSACNRQPYFFRIIDDKDLITKAAGLPNGSHTFRHNVKTMIFLIGDLSNYFDERDRHLIYIDGSLVAMNFILALETLGLSSCIINWADIPSNNKKLTKFLRLEKYEQCIMTISVGYAKSDGGIPSSLKKDLESIIKYN